MFLPVNTHATMDLTKIAAMRQAIKLSNIRSPPRQERLIKHFTPNTYKLLAQLREKSPDLKYTNTNYSLQEE